MKVTTLEWDSFDLMQELRSLLRLKNVYQLFWAGLDAFFFCLATSTNGPDFMHFNGIWGGLGLHHLNGISMIECKCWGTSTRNTSSDCFWQDWQIFIGVDLVFGGFQEGLGLYLLKGIGII